MAMPQWRLMVPLLLAALSGCTAGRASAPCGDSMSHISEKFTHAVEAIYHVSVPPLEVPVASLRIGILIGLDWIGSAA